MVNEYFNGSIMSVLNADKFAIKHIEPTVLKDDSLLMDHKFWDYKMWHPTVATMYFVHRFHTIAAEVIEREIGSIQAARYRKSTASYVLADQKLAVIRGFWKARMTADAIGCTYDTYIRSAIAFFRANYHMFATTKGKYKQNMPYASQLSIPVMHEAAIKGWTYEKEARFPLPQSADIPYNDQLWFRPEMEAWLREEAGKHAFGPAYIRKAQSSGIILTT